MRIVQPVDFLDVFVHLMSEADRLDVKISESLILRIHDQILCLHGHELGEEPGTEQLAVERLIPLVVIVLEGILKFNEVSIGLHSSNIEELFVDLLISVGVRTSEVIGLADCFLHLESIDNCKGNIVYEDRLKASIF